jgi:hypothetical protein
MLDDKSHSAMIMSCAEHWGWGFPASFPSHSVELAATPPSGLCSSAHIYREK